MKSSKGEKEEIENERFLRERPEPQGRPASAQQLPSKTRPVSSDPDEERYAKIPPSSEARPKGTGHGPSD